MFLQIDWTTICPEQKRVDADGAEGEGEPLYSVAMRMRTWQKWVSEGNPFGYKAGVSKKSWRRSVDVKEALSKMRQNFT